MASSIRQSVIDGLSSSMALRAPAHRFAASLASALFAMTGCAAVAMASSPPPPATPSGVTLVEVVRELEYSQPLVLWVRLGDENGRTLFIHAQDQPDVSNCVAECAAEFPPLIAPRGARPFGDWSLVRRKDGTLQWAYQKQPLYTWIQEKEIGEVATNVGLSETADAIFAQRVTVAGDLLSPDGWSVARFNPAASIGKHPDAIGVQLLHAVQSVALVDATGRTLYAYQGAAEGGSEVCALSTCASRWVPLAAPAIASKVGALTTVTRSDGSKQWAYNGRPLYTYSQDQLPGDAFGLGVDERWELAVVSKLFAPPNVSTTFLEGYGAALTLNGATLYGGYPFEKRWGGRNLRDTFKNAYLKGKQLGDAACADASCLQAWKPFLAAEDAQANGFWEPIDRPDGTRQWAYKGFALYTHAADKAPGDYYGQATYAFEYQGAGSRMDRVVFLHALANSSLPRPVTAGGVGIYWNIAKP